MNRIALLLLVGLLVCPAARAAGTGPEPPFEWDSKYASPGTSLALVEATRSITAAGTMVRYEAKTSGFPAERPLTLWLRYASGYMRFDATVDASGVAHVPEFGTGLAMAGAVKGQPLDVALAAPDSEIRAQAKVYPFPITARGDGECAASAEILGQSGDLFAITFSGFKPGETVAIVSAYRKERLPGTQTASEAGEVVFLATLPRRARGAASATAKGSACTVTLDYAVGRDALIAQ